MYVDPKKKTPDNILRRHQWVATGVKWIYVCRLVYCFFSGFRFFFVFFIRWISSAFGSRKKCIEKYSLHYAWNRFVWLTLIHGNTTGTPSVGRIKWVDRIFDFMRIQICAHRTYFAYCIYFKNTFKNTYIYAQYLFMYVYVSWWGFHLKPSGYKVFVSCIYTRFVFNVYIILYVCAQGKKISNYINSKY